LLVGSFPGYVATHGSAAGYFCCIPLTHAFTFYTVVVYILHISFTVTVALHISLHIQFTSTFHFSSRSWFTVHYHTCPIYLLLPRLPPFHTHVPPFRTFVLLHCPTFFGTVGGYAKVYCWNGCGLPVCTYYPTPTHYIPRLAVDGSLHRSTHHCWTTGYTHAHMRYYTAPHTHVYILHCPSGLVRHARINARHNNVSSVAILRSHALLRARYSPTPLHICRACLDEHALFYIHLHLHGYYPTRIYTFSHTLYYRFVYVRFYATALYRDATTSARRTHGSAVYARYRSARSSGWRYTTYGSVVHFTLVLYRTFWLCHSHFRLLHLLLLHVVVPHDFRSFHCYTHYRCGYSTPHSHSFYAVGRFALLRYCYHAGHTDRYLYRVLRTHTHRAGYRYTTLPAVTHTALFPARRARATTPCHPALYHTLRLRVHTAPHCVVAYALVDPSHTRFHLPLPRRFTLHRFTTTPHRAHTSAPDTTLPHAYTVYAPRTHSPAHGFYTLRARRWFTFIRFPFYTTIPSFGSAAAPAAAFYTRIAIFTATFTARTDATCTARTTHLPRTPPLRLYAAAYRSTFLLRYGSFCVYRVYLRCVWIAYHALHRLLRAILLILGPRCPMPTHCCLQGLCVPVCVMCGMCNVYVWLFGYYCVCVCVCVCYSLLLLLIH